MTIINSMNYSSGGEQEYLPVTTWAELNAALQTTQTLPVRVMNDISATAQIYSEATVTLDLYGHTITGDGTYIFLRISGNATITICDTSINGGGTIRTFNTGIYAGGEATITISRITLSNCGYGIGGSTTVILNNSTISNCTNGGILCEGPFTMNGGTIIGCTGTIGGGINISDGPFIMNGGTITGCTATNKGGGVFVMGTFTMTNGVITNCTAQYGGGVYRQGGKFTMSGGIICMNTATTSNGGVYGTYTKTGGYVGGNTPQE